MGKFKVKPNKKKSAGLEIVPKAVEEEVQLPESRKSDDKPLKKVKKLKILKFTFFKILFSDFRRNGSTVSVAWCCVAVESTSEIDT